MCQVNAEVHSVVNMRLVMARLEMEEGEGLGNWMLAKRLRWNRHVRRERPRQ